MNRQLTHGSLFAGIGGFDLGFERAGIKTIWQVEIDEYCRRVLERHFPDAERFNDVRECGRHNLKPVDIICGGFPCQDISFAGEMAGIDAERSGLWREYARIVGELRPRYVVVENVSALTHNGLGRVLGDLAACGYDAEWDCIPAARVGAPHHRDRLFLVAHAGQEFDAFACQRPVIQGNQEQPKNAEIANGYEYCMVPGIPARTPHDWWRAQSAVDRSCHGIPYRMERLGTLGNAVVPQIAEWIGRRIVAGWRLGKSA